jgi:DNA helicase-2/ATP-dependent DNA helicase PcrA
MNLYVLTGTAAAKTAGIDVTGLDKPAELSGPAVYNNINPKTYEDVYRIYHHAIYPHYLNKIPAVYAIPNPSALVKKLQTINDPAPISCPLTGEKIIRHLKRMEPVKEVPDLNKIKPNQPEYEITTPLDREQTRAASHFKGQALVIAPAGSGKTTTLVAHNILLVQRGVKPGGILNITFTKKAQKEMETRLKQSLGNKTAGKITVKTYHALAYMLMTEFEGKKPNIITARRQTLQTLIDENKCVLRPDKAEKFISYNLNNLKMPEDIDNREDPQLTEIYEKYLEYLHNTSQTDQDYLLMQLYQTLRNNPSKRHALMDYMHDKNPRYPGGRFQCVVVDEVQDNNFAQLVLTRFLIAPYDNLFAVGDEDQLLYTFRGSSVERILNLNQTYPHLKEIYLKTNYRCHPEITRVSDTLIKGNTMRREKTIKSGRSGTGRAVKIYAFEEMHDEYVWIAQKIKELILAGKEPGQIAVLYRTNAQGDAVSVQLKGLGIPCMVYKNGTSLFESAETETVINHLAAIYNPNNSQALLNCLRLPHRTNKLKKYEETLASAVYPVDTLRNIASSTRDWRVVEFCDNLNTGKIVVRSVQNMGQAINYIRNTFNDIDKYFCGSDDADRLSILEGIAGKFKTSDEFITWLQRVKTLARSETKETIDKKVQLMTVHTSKGMEFDTVFLVNCTEGHFPYLKSCTLESIEEERRIFYVGITRAIETLYMTGYQNDARYLSRYIEEIAGRANLPVETAPLFKEESLKKEKGEKDAVS